MWSASHVLQYQQLGICNGGIDINATWARTLWAPELDTPLEHC